MECGEGLRSRKEALKPIRTKTTNAEDGEIRLNTDDEVLEEEPLSPSARLFHEPTFNVYILAIMGCKTRIKAEMAESCLGNTLVKHPRFSSLQVVDEKGNMRWVRTKVDLARHIIVPEIDPNIESGDQFVEDYIYNLSKSTIDMSQPLWDLHILNVKTSNSEAIGIFRIHHSLGDGTSLVSLLLACTRKISDPEALPTIPVKKKKQETSNSWWLWRCLKWFWWVCQLLWHTVVDVSMFIATAWFLKDSDTPLENPPGCESNPRRIVYRTFSLDDIKLVKNAMNATVNDVALGVTQAGLSRYLNRIYGQGKKGEEADETKNNLPKDIRLRSTLLINMRPSAGIQALADMMEKDTEIKWGNWIGYVLLPFKIALREDPLDYIRDAKATVDRKKHSLEALFTFFIAEFVLKIFGVKRAGAFSHRILTKCSLCFSNLVGPLEEIGFYGHAMAFLAAGCYGQPQPLMINYQSFTNQMTIVVSADESVVPDPHQIIDDIEHSLKLVKDAVIARGLIKEDQNRN